MPEMQLTEADVARAQQIWSEYQKQHDVSARVGQAAGIDPHTGQIWFGESIVDISRKRTVEGLDSPLFFVRVGFPTYYRKGTRH
jgi:hypothetical protein